MTCICLCVWLVWEVHIYDDGCLAAAGLFYAKTSVVFGKHGRKH